jgi:protease-4
MNYTFVKDLIGSPWQIEVSTLNNVYPIFRGLFSGLQIDPGTEPLNQKPYAVKASDRSVIRQYSEGPEENPDDVEEVPNDGPNEKVINVIPIRSILTKHDQYCGPVGTRTLSKRLLNADADNNVIGHILIIESGGGQSAAAPEMTEAMEKCTKPIVAWIDGISASAAYHISCYAKEIIASRELDSVGCIGTMMLFSGRKAKSEENSLGEVSVTIYADQASEKNEDYEKAINEFDFKLIKEGILNPINEKFITNVKTQRPQVLPEQLKGKTYFAKDVIGSLVDSIGSFETAVDRVLELANYKNEPDTGNSNQSIKQTKQMKQFTQLNSALNVESLESSDEGVFLQEIQLEIIEQRLEANQQLVTERDQAVQERDTATASLTEAKANAAKAYDPFNAIDPTIAEATTPEAKAEALRSLLSKQPGTTPVGTLAKKDDPIENEADLDAFWNSETGKLAQQL